MEDQRDVSHFQTGFLLSRSSYDRSRHTEVILWVVTPDGPARLVIEGEQVVFFIREQDLSPVERTLRQSNIRYGKKTLSLKLFDQSSVCGVYFQTLDLAWKARQCLLEQSLTVYEADIRLHERFLMERFVYGGLDFIGQARECDGYIEYRHVRVRPTSYTPEFSVVSLDIECSAKGELYSIGLYGHKKRKQKQGLVLMIGESEPCSGQAVEWVKDEQLLLLKLTEVICSWDPDIIIGWNVINFDFRLLLKRAEIHGIKLVIGRGRQPAIWKDRKGESHQGFISIPGRMVIDGIDSLKAATWQFDSFSLEFVSQTLLGRGKATDDVDNRMAAITHDFLHNKQKLARYNLEDCCLVWDIFEKARLLDYLRLRSHLTGLELDRLGGSVAAFTNLYLPRLHRAGYIAPNLPDSGGLTSPGGYVMDSKPGLYSNVLVLDFKSLYPSIIRTFKIDPMGLVEGLLEPGRAIPGFRGASFSREKNHLPDIITSLWQQRDEAKREEDSARSQALKIIMNSFYGVLGSGGCRFYDDRLASSITMRGHDIMQQTAQWIEERGYQVIYGDTDSTFVLLGENVSVHEAGEIGRQLQDDINQNWQTLIRNEYDLDCFLELEYETLYTRFLMPTIRGSETGSKKRYAGTKHTEHGEELVFKGLETVRSDWTPLAKSFQIALYTKVFSGESPIALIKKFVEETLAGENDKQLVYRKRLRRRLNEYVKNVPPQVRAARKADKLNADNGQPLKYQHKGWISYLVTVAGPEAVEHQLSPIDHQHYIDKQLRPVADGILPFVGLSFDDVIDLQQGLF